MASNAKKAQAKQADDGDEQPVTDPSVKPEWVLGLDVGTSSVKGLLLDSAGVVGARASVPLPTRTPQPGWAEQDPRSWWNAARKVIASLLRTSNVRPKDVRCIGLSGQMHSAVVLDHHGEVLRPALLWCDARTQPECAALTGRVGEARLVELVGNAAVPSFTLPKLLWIREHEPELSARIATVLLPKDWLRYCLTGVLATEPSDASGTLLFDPRTSRWSDELLAAVELPRSLLPDVGGSAQVLGQVTPEAARATGLREGTPVVGGGADAACGALAAGVVQDGEVAVSWGISGTVLAPTGVAVVDPTLRAHLFCHVAEHAWYVMSVMSSAGGTFAWFRDHFTEGGRERDKLLDDEAAGVAIGAEGVTFLPYLQGEQSPHGDAASRGAFVGVTLAHGRPELARAVLEGMCFGLRDGLTVVREIPLPVERTVVLGGGARSLLVRKMLRNVLGVPTARVQLEEGPAFGAAMLASVGVGIMPSVPQAAATLVKRTEPMLPNAKAARAYEEPYQRFRALDALLRKA
jgi:xylulokinase